MLKKNLNMGFGWSVEIRTPSTTLNYGNAGQVAARFIPPLTITAMLFFIYRVTFSAVKDTMDWFANEGA